MIRKAGLPFLPGYTAPKILWLKRREPENFKRLRHVLLPHDYLNFHLTGNYSMEYGDASGTALMDIRRRVWSQPVLSAIDPKLGDWLPSLKPSHEPCGRAIACSGARLWAARRRDRQFAGGGDNMMGAIGTGNVKPGIVTASFGTSGTIYACSPRPVVDPRGEIAAFCSSTGAWLPLLCTMNVTTVTERVRALFGMDHAAMDAAASSVQAGCGGMVLLPYLAGERTPNVPDGSGVMMGLNEGSFVAAQWVRAAMEGVTLGMNYGLRRLALLGIRAREIRVTGGGARSAAWRQIMADVFGVPVVAMVEDEGAALGAALQAAWCAQRRSGRGNARIGDFTAGVVVPDESTRCRPGGRNVALLPRDPVDSGRSQPGAPWPVHPARKARGEDSDQFAGAGLRKRIRFPMSIRRSFKTSFSCSGVCL